MRCTNLYTLLFDCHDQLVEVPLGGAEAPAHWPRASDVTDITKVLAAGIHQHQLACPVHMQRISSPAVPLRWFKKKKILNIISLKVSVVGDVVEASGSRPTSHYWREGHALSSGHLH